MLNALNNHIFTMNMYLLINVLGVIPIELFWCYTMELGLNGIWIGQCMGSFALGVVFYSKLKGLNLENTVHIIR